MGSTLLLCFSVLLFAGVFKQRWLRRLVAGVVAGCIGIINALVGVSYYLQGQGLNEIFLYHFRLDTLDVVPAFQGLLAAGVTYCLLVVLCAVGASSRPVVRIPWIASIVAFAVSLGLFTPIQQLISTLGLFSSTKDDPIAKSLLAKLEKGEEPAVANGEKEKTRSLLEDRLDMPGNDDYDPNLARNLVLIYLEGIEQSYFDERRFPGLMPHLNRIQKENITFTNIHGEFLGGTIFGIFASQCGWPLHWDIYEGTRSRQALVPKLRCLGDVLKEKGYTSVFMGGAPLRFGQKGKFFSSHGYARVLGKTALRKRLKDPNYIHQWGLYDDSLMDLAVKESEILASSQPFFLNLLTIGTHYPGYISTTCPDYKASEDGILKAINCTDFLVARFIKKIRRSAIAENTVIAVMSDHLMWSVAARSHELGHPWDRRLSLILIVPGEKARVISAHGTHFDIPATLLSLLNIGFTGHFGLGSSLLDGDGLLFGGKGYLIEGGQLVKTETEKRTDIRNFLKSGEVKEFVQKHANK
jgi:hypothetical protein